MPRVVVLGTGTGVGKTHVVAALARGLAARSPRRQVLCIKPVETGIASSRAAPPDARSHASQSDLETLPPTDAEMLEAASFHVKHLASHPMVALEPPISPHRAARLAGVRLDAAALAAAVTQHTTMHCTTSSAVFVETAGGAFSPLSEQETNLDLALALEPARWLLVAPDSLGVLHDVRACLEAMRAVARVPDALVLSAARDPDASTGTNAGELPRVGLPGPLAVFERDRVPPLEPVLEALGLL